MAKCSFCGKELERGTGKMLVYISGKIDHFCSTKCEKNMLKLKRKPVKARWTETSRAERKSGKRQRSLSDTNEMKSHLVKGKGA